MRVSKEQRRIMVFLNESYSGAWSRGCVRRHLYGSRSTRVQAASFCRSLDRLVNNGLIMITTNFLVGCGADGAKIGLTVAGRGWLSVNNGGSRS